MSLTIGANLTAVAAANYLRTNKIGFDCEMLRPATGSRINSVSDDAAASSLSAALVSETRAADGSTKNSHYAALSAARDTDYSEMTSALAEGQILLKVGISALSKAHANKQYFLMLLQKKEEQCLKSSTKASLLFSIIADAETKYIKKLFKNSFLFFFIS